MKINVKPIQQSVIDFADRNMRLARQLTGLLKPDLDTSENDKIVHKFCEDNETSVVDILDGIAQINYRALYLGSKGVQENLSSLLNAPDEEIKTILAQWLAAEKAMWEVVDDAAEDEEND